MTRALILCATLLSVAAGCHLLAPFDPADQPTRPPEFQDDNDNDGGLGDAGDADGEDLCVPDCSDRSCGPNGCGGECPSSCAEGEHCVACPPGQLCAEAYTCSLPGPGQWVYVRTDTTFTMGSPRSEPGRRDNERRREVSLTFDFVVLSNELVQGDLANLLGGRNPSQFERVSDGRSCEDLCPGEHLTWHEAALTANWLSLNNGLPTCYDCDDTHDEHDQLLCSLNEEYPMPQLCPGYRLPTEAEWEFAARAGTDEATYNGELDIAPESCDDSEVLSPIAWWCGNSAGTPQPVASTRPNDFGLFDTLGNVNEWCHDFYSEELEDELVVDPFGPADGSEHVYRGGAFDHPPEHLRAAFRIGARSNHRSLIGLRPVRTVQRVSPDR